MKETEQIQNYLAGKLSASEQAAFQQRLSEDERLRTKVSEYQSIFEGFRALRTEAFEKEVKAWEQQSKTKLSPERRRPVRRLYLKYAAVAAALLLLLSLGVSYFTNDPLQGFLQENLAYAQPVLDRGDETETTFKKINVALEKEDYRTAAQFFEELAQLDPQPDDWSKDAFYWRKIICLLQDYQNQPSEQTKRAIQETIARLLPIANSKDIYKEKAETLEQLLR